MKARKRLAALAAGAALAGLCSLSILSAPALAASTADPSINAVDDNLSRIERILDDVGRAKEIITGTPGTTDATRAQEVLRRKEAELEKARVDAMSAASGVSRERIAALRAQGKNWGAIAGEFGVSPNIVGVTADGKDVGYAKTKNKGKKKGWKHGMPPGQAKKHGYDD